MKNLFFIGGFILLAIILIKILDPLIDKKDPESVIAPALLFIIGIVVYIFIFGYYC